MAGAVELLDKKGKLSEIPAGAIADIVRVNDDPLKDISTLERVSFVMKEGESV